MRTGTCNHSQWVCTILHNTVQISQLSSSVGRFPLGWSPQIFPGLYVFNIYAGIHVKYWEEMPREWQEKQGTGDCKWREKQNNIQNRDRECLPIMIEEND